MGWFNLATGEKGSTQLSGTATNVSSRIVDKGHGLYRCEVTVTLADPTAALVSIGVTADKSGTRVAGGRYVSCAQLEAGVVGSSPILTEGAQITRAGETGVVSNLAPWFNPLKGTIFVECINRLASDGGTFGVSLGSDSKNYIGLAYSGPTGPTKSVYIRSGNAGPVLGSGGMAPALKQALAWDSSGLAMSNNGEVVVTSPLPSDGMPPISSLRVGNSHFSSAIAPMHLRAIRYYPWRLTNAELQALTA
jgi:hypothetical protein